MSAHAGADPSDVASDVLPEAYLTALLMRGAGLGDAAIARRLGVPLESVAGLILLAERKVARLFGQGPPVG